MPNPADQAHPIESPAPGPGAQPARVKVDVVSHADHTISPTYVVQSSHGFSMIQNLPPTLQPNQANSVLLNPTSSAADPDHFARVAAWAPC